MSWNACGWRVLKFSCDVQGISLWRSRHEFVTFKAWVCDVQGINHYHLEVLYSQLIVSKCVSKYISKSIDKYVLRMYNIMGGE